MSTKIQWTKNADGSQGEITSNSLISAAKCGIILVGAASATNTQRPLTTRTGVSSCMAEDYPTIPSSALRANPKTGRRGPAPNPPRDGDKKQARRRINVEVREGRRPHPNELPCAICDHAWSKGERRHEYDHYLGYGPENHYTVRALCTTCHAKAHNWKTHCAHGHEYTPENTVIDGRGRKCLACRRERDRTRVRPAGYWKAVNERRRKRNG